jgi:predicted transcriptional regulator
LSLIPAVLVLNEKEAEICFRFIEGRVDYAGFYGGDEEFLGWTKDLFLYYWANGVRHPVSRTDY